MSSSFSIISRNHLLLLTHSSSIFPRNLIKSVCLSRHRGGAMAITIHDYMLPDETHNLYNVNFFGDIIHAILTHDPTVVSQWLSEIQSLNHSQDRRLIIGLDVKWHIEIRNLSSNNLSRRIPTELFSTSIFDFTGTHLTCGNNFQHPCVPNSSTQVSTRKSKFEISITIASICAFALLLLGAVFAYRFRRVHKTKRDIC